MHIKIDKAENTKWVSKNLLEKPIEKRRFIMVLVHSPWCGFCQAMRESWNSAVQEIESSSNSALDIVEIDSSAMGSPPSKMEKLAKSNGVPHIVMIHPDDKVETYSGNRSAESFVSFANVTNKTSSKNPPKRPPTPSAKKPIKKPVLKSSKKQTVKK